MLVNNYMHVNAYLNILNRKFKGFRRVFVIVIICLVALATMRKFSTRNITVQKNPVPYGRNERKITVGFHGRAGNQMFQYASLIGIAKMNNMTPVLLEITELWNMFDLPISTAYMDKSGKYTEVKEEHTAVYAPKFENIISKTDVYLNRYLQSWKYFENVKMDLKQRHYKIKNELLEEASPYVEDIKRKVSKEAVFVGVHVRRGDIVHERKPVGHIPAPIPYFYRAMNYFRKRYSIVVFVMISNSMMWCQDHLDDSSNVYHVETGDPYIDFAILHKMDHLILSVGTFGWWAGYLSPGTVIFYKGYPKANTTMSIEMKQTDFIPRHWVGL